MSAREIDDTSVGLPTAYQCNRCTIAEVLNDAKASGRGRRYYYDLVGNVIHRVVTECGYGAGSACDVYEDLVPAEIAAKFSIYHWLWLQNASSESFDQQANYSVTSDNTLDPRGRPVDDGYVNAFDTVTTKAINDDVIAYLNSPKNYTDLYAALVLLIEPRRNPGIEFDKLTIRVAVVFNDGSKREYKFDKAPRSFEAVAGSARDANGNDVPESKAATR